MATLDEITVKEEKIEAKLKEIFEIMGVKETDSNIGTAHRVAKMWVREIFRNDTSDKFKEELDSCIKTFNPVSHRNQMIVTTVPFHAFCEHHLLPFSGKAQIGYVPSTKIIGLSKIPRIVDYLCHEPQLQEKLCSDIVDLMKEYLNPTFVCVRLIAEHSCVACRGIEKDCETDTFDYSSNFVVGSSLEQKYVDEFFRRVNR